MIGPCRVLVERALTGKLVIPDFADFCREVAGMYEQTEVNREGVLPEYIPQLTRVDPEQFGVAICTIDGQMFSIGDDFWIENDDGERAFKVDGKALRIRDTFVLETTEGKELFTIKERKLSIRDKMAIERDGKTVATVRKALVTPLRERFSIDVEDGPDMEAKGNIVDHEYKIERDGKTVAEISKRWFRVRDTYGIEIAPGQDEALILAVSVCIDRMARG